MTLDIIVWAPEAFFLVLLLSLIWYGSGPVDNPINEKVYMCASALRELDSLLVVGPRDLVVTPKPISGPLLVLSHLNMWAVTVCFLMVCLVWNCSLSRLMPGRVFRRDFGAISIATFLWGLAGLFLFLQNPWQKWAGIVHLEYVYLTLLFLLGVHLLCYTVDLMGLYVCLELQSFSIVVLCRLNYATPYAIEAGMKYFLLRAFSSSLMLLGMGLIYSQTGHTDLSSIQELLTVLDADLLTMLGVWLIGLGLLWKLALAPLHMWAADVYMGAWSSVTLMISTLPKVLVLFFWARGFHTIWSIGFGSTLLLFFRRASFIVGMFAPLAQSTLKRLLAFSSVGNMGLLLMPFCLTNTGLFTQRLWVHFFLYIVSSMVVWALIMWPFYRPLSNTLNATTSVYVSGPQYVWDLTNLNQISGALALAWAVAMLSFLGLPPVLGFLGKLSLFWYSLSNNMYALVSVALVSSLVSSVYYLRILKVCYVDLPLQAQGSYGTFRPSQAYLVLIGIRLLIGIMWHVLPLALGSHLLLLAISYKWFLSFLFWPVLMVCHQSLSCYPLFMTRFFLVLSYARVIWSVLFLRLALRCFSTSDMVASSLALIGTRSADLPTPWQMLFQDPLTLSMEGIVDLHHDICFFLITILILVLWLGARIVYRFHHSRMPVPERFNHHTSLELIWAILPSLVVTMILLPSLTLIYTFDDLILKPALTVKISGKQWYWSYAIDEHVRYNLVDVNRLLETS